MSTKLPAGFAYLENFDSHIQYDIRYATDNNLVGRKLDGYKSNVCIVSTPLGQALKNIQSELQQQGLEIFVFETYRPQRASDDLQQWGLEKNEQHNKTDYYPNIDKTNFGALGYINQRSSHTRGAAVDLTIINSSTNKALEMGTRFDFMDPLSHPDNTDITKVAFKNRQFLQVLMKQHGFESLATEWWHFKLADEPFSECYFDFVVE